MVINKVKKAVKLERQICLTCITVYEIIKGLKYRENKNKERDFNDSTV
jgi:predicted nucleic acid-binding protein